MKWFKHISDSLDDPFVFDLMSEYGPSGYLVFFGIIEIYAREYKPDHGWKLCTSVAYLKAKLHLTHGQVLLKCLKSISDAGKWNIEIGQKNITINIPKFQAMIDEYTDKQARKSRDKVATISGESRDKVLQEAEADKELDKDKELKAGEVFTSPVDNPNEKDAFLKELKTLLEKTKERFPSFQEQMEIHNFVKANIRSGNKKAIIHTINRLLETKQVENITGLLITIFKIENGKYNARDYENKAQEFKTDKHPMTSLGNIMSGMLKSIPGAA
jgi:hypothetical protein